MAITGLNDITLTRLAWSKTRKRVVAIGHTSYANYRVAYSSDCQAWTQATLPTGYRWTDIDWSPAGDYFVIVGYAPTSPYQVYSIYSDDGIVWSTPKAVGMISTTMGGSPRVKWAGSTFVVTGADNNSDPDGTVTRIGVSSDPKNLTWTLKSINGIIKTSTEQLLSGPAAYYASANRIVVSIGLYGYSVSNDGGNTFSDYAVWGGTITQAGNPITGGPDKVVAFVTSSSIPFAYSSTGDAPYILGSLVNSIEGIFSFDAIYSERLDKYLCTGFRRLNSIDVFCHGFSTDGVAWDITAESGNSFRGSAILDIPDLGLICATSVDNGAGIRLSSDGESWTTEIIPVNGVSVTPSVVNLEPTQTQQLTATVSPENATIKNVTFESDTPSIATVDSTGLVTAVALGTATITVTTVDGGFTHEAHVTVSDVPPPDPGTNDFLPYATGSNAAVMTQAQWRAGSERATGHVPNSIASPQLANKAERQGVNMAAAIGTFIANQGIDALDDGDIDSLAYNFEQAIKAVIAKG